MVSFWLMFGLVLVVLEFLLPGLVVIFLGASALLVSLGLWLGLIEGWVPATLVWFISSILLVLGLRGFILRFAPTGDSFVAQIDRLDDLLGQVVKVEETVSEEPGGRIFVFDSTWPAVTKTGVIPKGAQAIILDRTNLTFVVEPDTSNDSNPTGELDDNRFRPLL